MIKVLILDDDSVFATLLADFLNKRAGEFSAIATSTADKALEAARQAATAVPFDVFLIDQRLGPGPDGIKVMVKLRGICPDAEAIIFANDPQSGMQAYEAGAYRYLSKPFSREEMLWIVQSANDHRKTRSERDWHRLLNVVAEEAQRAQTFEEVAQIAVQSGRAFGFERARFWRVNEDQRSATGVCESGNVGLENFADYGMAPNRSPYLTRTLTSGKVQFFDGEELGPLYTSVQFGQNGFLPPVGEWVYLPFSAGGTILAAMSLDNAINPHRLNDTQRELLKVFGSQITAALERACAFERQQVQARQLEFLNELDRVLSSNVTLDTLELVLEKLREMLGTRVDVRNLLVVVRDDESDRLIYKLHYANGVKQRLRPYIRRVQDPNLIPYIIKNNETVLLPDGTAEFRRKTGLSLYGAEAKSFLGVPLAIQGRTTGAIVLEDNECPNIYTETHRHLLEEVAWQVSGMIEALRLKEKERANRASLEVAQEATSLIFRLAQQNDPRLWHVVLTAGTADYGMGFDRAVLFLTESGGARLRAKMGIGHFDEAQARSDWDADFDRQFTFSDYQEQLFAGQLKPTSVEQFITGNGGWQLALDGSTNAIREVLESGQAILVKKEDCARRLPSDYVARFGQTDYAVIPVRGSDRPIGVVIVDKRFHQEPILPFYLDNFESMLAKAGLAFENQRERDIREQLFRLNQIVTQWAEYPLNEALTLICQTAQSLAEADSCVIYPLESDPPPYRFDLDNAGHCGLLGDLSGDGIATSAGLSARVLRTGSIMVEDVEHDETLYSGKRLKDRRRIQSEEIKAFVGWPIRDGETGDSLGVMFINYRAPQSKAFLEQHPPWLTTLANLAVTAIKTHRQNASAESRDMEAAQAELKLSLKEDELNVHRRFLLQALRLDNSEEDVIRSLLDTGKQLLAGNDAELQLILLDWQPPQGSERPERYRMQYRLTRDGTLKKEKEFDLNLGIIGREFFKQQRTKVLNVPNVKDPAWSNAFIGDANTRSELDAPILTGRDEVIGVFKVESPRSNAFGPHEMGRLDRLAGIAAQALANARWREHVNTAVFDALKQVVEPVNLGATFDAVGQAAQRIAPDLSLLTIWRLVDGKLRLAKHFGVNDEEALNHVVLRDDSIVWQIARESMPIYEPAATQSRWSHDFVKHEQIESFAAFPLRAGDEPLGVMFLSYRVPHPFTPQEKVLLGVLADITASSIRDAELLEKEKRTSQRLDVAMRVTEAVGTELDLDRALLKIMSALRGYFPDAAILTVRYDEDEKRLAFTNASKDFYAINVAGYDHLQYVALDGPSLASKVAREYLVGKADAMAVVNDDVDRDPNFLRLVQETRSEICVPFASGNRLLGILILESPRPNTFNPQAIELVRSAAQQASIAIDRAEQSAKLSFQTSVAAATAWASDIAHDVNREIGAIRRRAYLMQLDPQLNEKHRVRAQQIDELAESLIGTVGSSLIGRSLDKTKPIAIDHWMGVHLPELIQSKKQFDLNCRLQAGRKVTVHVGALLRVFKHLIRNAIEHTPEGGKVIVRSQVLDNHFIEIQVEDEGKGIRPELRHILLQQPLTTKDDGGGMGLIIARSLVEQMDGRLLLLDQEQGRGAVFSVRLPCVVD